MTWDAETRLILAVQDGIVTDGARLKRTVGGKTIGATPVRDDGGPRQALVATPDPSIRIAGAQAFMLHTVNLGSLREVTTAGSALVGLPFPQRPPHSPTQTQA